MSNMLGKVIKNILPKIFLLVLAGVFIFPVLITVINSFLTESEVTLNYLKEGTNRFVLIPAKFSLSQYYEILIMKYRYLSMFWVSVKFSVGITVLHLIISITSAYVFAKVEFKGRSILFFIYIIVMMMPFQVTLLPNYIQAKFLHIFDTSWSIILPGAFSPFGVFLLTQFMRTIPDEYIETIVLESNSVIDILRMAVIPLIKPAVIALAILTFAENWNMVEQPLVLLKDASKHPLSTAFNSIIAEGRSIAFAGSVIYMMPIIILFMYFEEQIIEGVSKLKF